MKTARIQDVKVEFLPEHDRVRLNIRVLAYNVGRDETYWVLAHSRNYSTQQVAERKFNEFCKLHDLNNED